MHYVRLIDIDKNKGKEDTVEDQVHFIDGLIWPYDSIESIEMK